MNSILFLLSALISAIGGGGPVHVHPAIGGGGPVHAAIGGGGPVHAAIGGGGPVHAIGGGGPVHASLGRRDCVQTWAVAESLPKSGQVRDRMVG